MKTATTTSHGVLPFEEHLRTTLQGFRAALAEATSLVRADATRPQQLSRQLGLDKSLAWHLSKILTEEDAFAAVPHLPGKAGMRITVRAFQKAGASGEAIDRLREAIDRLDRMVETHCGDRATLDLMLGHLDKGNGPAAREEAQRKKLFHGTSAVWGVQARVQMSAHFISMGTEPDKLDFATAAGLLGFRRLRQDAAWAVASVRNYADDGTPLPDTEFESLDPDVAPGEAPLLGEFCSDPPPTLRVAPGLPGVTPYELAEGPVGNTAACDCVSGWMSRNFVEPWRTGTDRYGEHMVHLTTPVRLLVHELFVHRDVPFNLPPTAHLYSQLPGGPVYPRLGRDQGLLTLRENVIQLGSPPDVISPELPRHRRLVEMVCRRLGRRIEDFRGYRVKLRYPPIPTILVLRHELPERP